MSLLSRQEINLRRLLAKCELLSKSNGADDILSKNYQNRINALKNELGMVVEEDKKDNYQNMRNDLLNVRKRKPSKTATSDNLDELINYNDNVQQKVTDDILALTKNLKEQSELANKIIKKDTEVLTRSSSITEQNKAKLEVESYKLEEHSRRAWKCWMWVMLIMVMVVFFTMVMFIKVTRKKY